jgi:sugar phosphate permease
VQPPEPIRYVASIDGALERGPGIGRRVVRRTRGIFFGWWIVAGGIGIQMLTAMLLGQAYGAYVVELQRQFGWNKTSFSIAYAIQQAESGLLGPFQGYLLTRFGPRNVMRVGLVVLAAGFIAFSQIQSISTFYLTFLVMAIGTSLAGFMSITTTLVNWFERRRATALAVMQTGGAIGGLLVPIVAWSLVSYGWRTTAFASGIVVLVVGLPLVQLMRQRPEDYGYLPDGVPMSSTSDASPASNFSLASMQREDFTTREALHSRAFWYLSFGHSLAMFVVASVSVHLIPYLTEDEGFSLEGAAFVVSIMTASMMVGQLTGGVLGDRFSKRHIVTVATFGHMLAMLTLAFGTSYTLIVLAVVLQGAAHGLRGVLMMPIRADYFGRQQFATIMGFSSLVMMWGVMSGPIVVGLIADAGLGYQPAFLVAAGAAAVAAVLFMLARPPQPPARLRRAEPA